MAATKLSLYNEALRYLGDARLATTTDDVEARYALDDAYDASIIFVLRQAAWRFALKTAALGGTTGPLPGFLYAMSRPADWLHTHALFALSGAVECPIDIREQGNKFSSNQGGSNYIRYVSSDYADPALASNPWPEHFAQLVAAYLAFSVADRVTGERGASGRMSQLFSSLLAEATAHDALIPDPWLAAQLDGSFRRISASVVNEGFWRFARITVLLDTSVGPGYGGLAHSYAFPADWGQTRALYKLNLKGQRAPFDIREVYGYWHTNATSFYADYVSATLALDSTKWPDLYRQAVLRLIHFDQSTRRDTGGGGYAQVPPETAQAGAAWKDALSVALANEADPADPWFSHQIDGSFIRGSQAVINRGFWWWGLKEVAIEKADQLTTEPDAGFPYRYALPSDWLRTHSLFEPWDGQECPINIRESARDWSTDSESFVARYISTDVFDAMTWPEIVAKAVLAYLDWQAASDRAREDSATSGKDQGEAAEFDRLMTEALAVYSRKPDEWLRFQLSGDYQQSVKMMLEKGRWRFAVKTVSLTESSDPLPAEEASGAVSNSYGYRFILPNDHLKTLWVYYVWSSGLGAMREDLDFREEGGAIHANRTPITLRYVSRLGMNSTTWSSHFRDACLAWLEHSEARANPQMVSVAAEKLKLFQQACEAAEDLDDGRDMPPVYNASRFVAGRSRRSGTWAKENAWPPWG